MSSDVIDPCQMATDRIDYMCEREVQMVGDLVTLREDRGYKGLVVQTYSVDELNRMIETNNYETEGLIQLLVGKNKVDKVVHQVYWSEGYTNPWFGDELIFLTGGD